MGCADLQIDDTSDPTVVDTEWGTFALDKAASPRGEERRANPQDSFPGQGNGNGGAFPGQGNGADGGPFGEDLCAVVDPDDSIYFWYELGYAADSGMELAAQACRTDADCYAAGCNGQTCTAQPDTLTICAYLPELEADGCLCVAGECAWATACEG